MLIAFTSCFDATADDVQTIWTTIKSHSPSVLLLMGDSIYMDYWPRLGEPRDYSDDEFARKMHWRYQLQWQVQSFRELVCSVPKIGIIWDDHDFAWNGACGRSRTDHCVWDDEAMRWACTPADAPDPSPDVVPDIKQRISYALFQQFKTQLRTGDPDAAYPPLPPMRELLATPAQGIQESFDVEGVRFLMLDGRTYRQPKFHPASPGELLGEQQQNWLRQQVLDHAGLKVLGSGTTLKRSPESWDHYRDFEWLMQQQFSNTLVLSGDIHSNADKVHKLGDYMLQEITASGAALPKIGGDTGNFGVIQVMDGQITHIALHDEICHREVKSIPMGGQP